MDVTDAARRILHWTQIPEDTQMRSAPRSAGDA